MRIEYSDDVPAEIRETVDKYKDIIDRYSPGWLDHILVKFSHDPERGASLCIYRKYRYRLCILHVDPNFLLNSEQERRNAFIHEMIHVNMAPYDEIVELMQKEFEKRAPELKDWLGELVTLGMEQTVCDMTKMIQASEQRIDYQPYDFPSGPLTIVPSTVQR